MFGHEDMEGHNEGVRCLYLLKMKKFGFHISKAILNWVFSLPFLYIWHFKIKAIEIDSENCHVCDKIAMCVPSINTD